MEKFALRIAVEIKKEFNRQDKLLALNEENFSTATLCVELHQDFDVLKMDFHCSWNFPMHKVIANEFQSNLYYQNLPSQFRGVASNFGEGGKTQLIISAIRLISLTVCCFRAWCEVQWRREKITPNFEKKNNWNFYEIGISFITFKNASSLQLKKNLIILDFYSWIL